MNEKVRKFLEFNGTTIFFVAADGQYWIALRPICAELKVNFNRQFFNIKKDPILKDIERLHVSTAADNKRRKMICMPEFFIYLWILSIRSTSEELQIYKLECSKILYQHFHGSVVGKRQLSKVKEKILKNIKKM